MKKIIPLALITLLISACLPKNIQVPQSPLLKTLERKSGLIAYVGGDGNMYISDQGGGQLKQLTKDARVPQSQSDPYRLYLFPTWSQDGSQLAFTATSGTSSQNNFQLLVANADDGKVKDLYSSASERPVYLDWSPDNANVSVLTTSSASQSLILQNIPTDGGERTVIDTGSPYYWSWAPDGSTMITHSGGPNSSAPEHLAFLSVGSEVIEDGLDSTPASFQAPAWSPDGSHIVLTRLNDKTNEIILTDAGGKYQKTLGKFQLNTAFAWSFDSTKVAYIDGTQTMSAGALGELHVVDIETGEEKVVTDKQVYALFWSPDGKRIAFFAPQLVNTSSSSGSGESQTAGQQLVLELNMLDVATGESTKLFTYRPTDLFANILPYFDQYHQSATIWSPDNNNLVLSFLDSSGNPGIAVVASSGQLEPRILTNGYIAFWSWK